MKFSTGLWIIGVIFCLLYPSIFIPIIFIAIIFRLVSKIGSKKKSNNIQNANYLYIPDEDKEPRDFPATAIFFTWLAVVAGLTVVSVFGGNGSGFFGSKVEGVDHVFYPLLASIMPPVWIAYIISGLASIVLCRTIGITTKSRRYAAIGVAVCSVVATYALFGIYSLFQAA